MATATRTSTFTPQKVGAVERYIKDEVQDLVFTQNVYLWLMKQKGRIRVGKWGSELVVPFRSAKTAAPETGRHLDPVTFSIPGGPEAAKFTYGEYRKGISYSWSEMADNGGAMQQVDLIQERIDAELATFAEAINYDLIQGNASDALRMLGLMQGLHPKDHSGVSATCSRANMRLANNSYGDITRTGSTGWENVSIALDLTANSGWSGTDNTFVLGTNNVRSPALKALDNAMLYGATYGKIKPNCLLSTPRPWMDYQHAFSQVVRYVNEGKKEGDLGIPYIMHNGAMWGVDEALAATGTTTSDESTADADCIVGLNTDYWNLDIEEGAYFDPAREWTQLPNQVVEATILLFRGFHYTKNPRYSFIAFNYGVA